MRTIAVILMVFCGLPSLANDVTVNGRLLVQPPDNFLGKGIEIYQNFPSPDPTTTDRHLNSIWVDFNGEIVSSEGKPKSLSVFQVNLATGPDYKNTFAEGQTVAGSFGLTPKASNVSLGDQVALSGGFYYKYGTLGRVYGIAGGGTCASGCSMPGMYGIESDTAIVGSGSAQTRFGFNAVNQGTKPANNVDAAYAVSNGYGSTNMGAFKAGIQINDFAVSTSGSLIKADYTGDIANLVYAPGLTVTGDIINLPSFIVRGTGHIIARSFRTYGPTANCSDGGVCYGGVINNDKTACGNLSGSVGCLQINVGGAMRYMPIF